MYRTDFQTLWENMRVGCSERTALKQVSRVKQITSPGWMHETGAQGWEDLHWEDPEGWDGEGNGRGDRDGEHM